MPEDKKQGYLNIFKYLIAGMPKTSFAAIYIIICCAFFRNSLSVAQHLFICIGTGLVCGYEILIGAYKAVKSKRFLHPDIYITVAVLGTFIIGMYYEAVFAAAIFAICRSMLSTVNEWIYKKHLLTNHELYLMNSDKSPFEKKILNAVNIFSVLSLFVIIILTIIIPLLWRVPLSSWLRRAFILLTAACPGAIIIASEIEMFKFINAAQAGGIKYKNKNMIDDASKVTSLVFGKMELIPFNKYTIEKIEPVNISKSDLLLLAAYTCSFSSDKILYAVYEESGVDIDISKVEMYKDMSGRGCAIALGTAKIIACRHSFINELKLDIGDTETDDMSVYIAVNGSYAGRIKINNTDTSSVSSAVSKLKSYDFDRIMLLTSDSVSNSAVIASNLGIDEYWAEMSYEKRIEKLSNLQQMQLENEKIAFVADSINDKEIIKVADVSITIGETASVLDADIQINITDYSKIADAIIFARKLKSNINHNLKVAITLKIISILIAIVGFAGIWSIAVIDMIASLLVLTGYKTEKYV